MTRREALSKYLDPPVTETRLTRQWTAIRERYRPHRPKTPLVIAASTAVVLAAMAVLWVVSTAERAPSPWDGTVLATSAEPLDVTLKDGSRLEVGARTRMSMVDADPGGIRFALDRGTTRFTVAKKPTRTFAVVSHGVEVRVTGTRFSVSALPVAGGHRVSVEVEEGRVVVGNGGLQPLPLGPGESWSTLRGDPKAASEQVEPAKEPTTASPARESAAPPAPRAPGPRRSPSAKELMETANTARQLGNAAAAAQSYEVLLARFPRDPRAGLAAFELGRLKMDRLGDLSGAVKALQRAIRLAPGSGFREDALARLVRAYDTMGARASCLEAQSAYLKSYPRGVHRAAIENHCAAR